MTALQVMKSEYEGHEIAFNEEGWFNATQAAAKYGKLSALHKGVYFRTEGVRGNK